VLGKLRSPKTAYGELINSGREKSGGHTLLSIPEVFSLTSLVLLQYIAAKLDIYPTMAMYQEMNQ
jgi:hypothetical protein